MTIEQSLRAVLQSERKDPGLVYPGRIPVPLLHHPQWVCWRYVHRGEGRKPDKQPVNPRTLGNAGVHWANT
jgi:primase-polymerase (primpol)-like protein